jgi:hypothetical protein
MINQCEKKSQKRHYSVSCILLEKPTFCDKEIGDSISLNILISFFDEIPLEDHIKNCFRINYIPLRLVSDSVKEMACNCDYINSPFFECGQ